MKERGRIAEGWHADLVMFDPATVNHGPERTRYDLPAGAPRLVADAKGITSVWVGGVEVRHDGSHGRDARHHPEILSRHRDSDGVMTSRAPLEEFDPASCRTGC